VPVPDPAATVLLLRPASSGFEVLMVHRNARGFFGSFVVFPGGRVEDVDVPPGLSREDDISHRRAAIRELAEETGIYLSVCEALPAPDLRGEELYRWMEGQDDPAVDSLVLISRWVTPEMSPRRFDARFYLARCDEAPEVDIDAEELVDHSWVSPSEALKRHESGDWPMISPTISHLRWLARRMTIDEAFSSARGADGRTLIEPRQVEDGSLLPIYMPLG
jgi:8-oxo-dGTP pyrophosphatase MutT (NUDIX family)